MISKDAEIETLTSVINVAIDAFCMAKVTTCRMEVRANTIKTIFGWPLYGYFCPSPKNVKLACNIMNY